MAKTRPKRISSSRAHLRRVLVPIALVGVVVLLLLLDALLSLGRIHSGLTISGIDFGRMPREEAVAELSHLVDESMAEPLVLVRDTYRWPVLAADLGVEIDPAATVEEAMAITRKGNLFQQLAARISLYFGDRDVRLQGTIDQERMDKIISLVAEKLDLPPVNASLKFEGDEITIIACRDGFVVDRPVLRYQLHEVLLSLHSTDVPIPMVAKSPNVKAADTSGAREAAKLMVSAPITLTHEDATWTMPTESIKLSLDFTVTGTRSSEKLVPYVSPDKVQEFLQEISETVKQKPRKATWETDGTTATIIPALFGKELDTVGTAAALTEAASSKSQRVAQVAIKETPPERTTEQAQAMGIVKSIGSYTTKFTGSANRVSNIQRAASLIDSTLVEPGGTFSFNNTVGQRTEERGFKTAPVIKEDGRLEDDLGGGICQVATTLFNAAFFTGLPIVQRENHTLYIDHYPMGRDATVSWGYPDLQFRNDTDYWLLIKAYASSNSVTFAIYGTPDGRKVTYSTSDWQNIVKQTEKRIKTDELPLGETRVKDYGQDGRSCTVTRTVTVNSQTRTHTFYSNYPMVPKLIEEGAKPKETTTTTAPTTTTSPPSTGSPTPTALPTTTLPSG